MIVRGVTITIISHVTHIVRFFFYSTTLRHTFKIIAVALYTRSVQPDKDARNVNVCKIYIVSQTLCLSVTLLRVNCYTDFNEIYGDTLIPEEKHYFLLRWGNTRGKSRRQKLVKYKSIWLKVELMFLKYFSSSFRVGQRFIIINHDQNDSMRIHNRCILFNFFVDYLFINP